MLLRPPISTRTEPLCPYTTLCRCANRTTWHRPKFSAPRPTPDSGDFVSMHALAATQWRLRIDAALERTLPAADEPPRRLHAAMRHAALLGGKRMRPLLVYATGTADRKSTRLNSSH